MESPINNHTSVEDSAKKPEKKEITATATFTSAISVEDLAAYFPEKNPQKDDESQITDPGKLCSHRGCPEDGERECHSSCCGIVKGCGEMYCN